MMTTQAQLGDNTYTLERFPLDQKIAVFKRGTQAMSTLSITYKSTIQTQIQF